MQTETRVISNAKLLQSGFVFMETKTGAKKSGREARSGGHGGVETCMNMSV